VPEHQPPSESTALPGITLDRTMIRSGRAPFLLITLHIAGIHSALRWEPSPIRGRSTILGPIPIPIARILIATDGLAPDAITAGRQIGRRKISLGILFGTLLKHGYTGLCECGLSVDKHLENRRIPCA
jgi:hypothetical protein